jgi:hypothetical protein
MTLTTTRSGRTAPCLTEGAPANEANIRLVYAELHPDLEDALDKRYKWDSGRRFDAPSQPQVGMAYLDLKVVVLPAPETRV